MASIIENLNEVISTKNEIKGILRDNGIDPGEVFSEYPDMLRSIVGGGSISGDTINSYISAYLDSYNYINSDSLSAYNFIDQDELSANSYVTTSDIPDISTKADKSELNAYLSVSNLTKPAGVDVLRLLSSGLEINTSGNIYPSCFSYTNLVNSGNYNWIGSGTLKNYVNGRLAEIEASYATTTDLNNHLPYLGTLQAHYTNSEHFLPKKTNTYYLGNSNFRWELSYVSKIYTDNLYISSETYLPVNTYWYDGTTYHWLGSLFN